MIETANRVGGIEGIRRLGCGRIPNKYVSHSNFTTIIIKDIKTEIKLGIEKRVG